MTKKKKSVWKILYKIGVTLVYIACILVLCMQALTPGKESSDISGSVGNVIDDIMSGVTQPEVEFVAVNGLTVDSMLISGQAYSFDDLTMLAGNKGKIQCTVSPENATNKALLYSSSDNSIAEVYADGTVLAKKNGQTSITVTSKESEQFTQTVTVSVKEIAVEGIHISAKKSSIYKGDSLGLDIAYTPANATERAVTWTSSDTSIITVNASGQIKGVAVGTATITATSKIHENLTSSVTITVEEKPVIPPVPVTSITLDHDGVGYIGESGRVNATVSPANATNKSLVWSSSNPDVATVDQSGNVTYLSAGTTTITARSSAYAIEDSVEITVKEVLSKTITLKMEDLTETKNGYSIVIKHSATLTATLDENATVLEVTFTSSNPDVASISSDGTIEGVSIGKTTITVSTSYDGETVSEEFELTVTYPPFNEQFDNFALWVRKTFGHFGAFIVLGIFAALTYHTLFPKSTKGKFVAFLVCIAAGFAVAGLTEILQLPIFTEGRYCSFDDVMLDFRGYCYSSMLIFAWSFLVSICRTFFKHNGRQL